MSVRETDRVHIAELTRSIQRCYFPDTLSPKWFVVKNSILLSVA